MLSSNELYYSYNLFAYDYVKEKYYFVAIASYQIENDNLEMRSACLFMEKEALFSWWNNTFGFYESDLIKDIPDKYLYFTLLVHHHRSIIKTRIWLSIPGIY